MSDKSKEYFLGRLTNDHSNFLEVAINQKKAIRVTKYYIKKNKNDYTKSHYTSGREIVLDDYILIGKLMNLDIDGIDLEYVYFHPEEIGVVYELTNRLCESSPKNTIYCEFYLTLK